MTKFSSNHDEKGHLQAWSPRPPEFTPRLSDPGGWGRRTGPGVALGVRLRPRVWKFENCCREERSTGSKVLSLGDDGINKHKSPLCALVRFVPEWFDLLASVGFPINVDGVENRIGTHSPNGLFPESLTNSRIKLRALEKTSLFRIFAVVLLCPLFLALRLRVSSKYRALAVSALASECHSQNSAGLRDFGSVHFRALRTETIKTVSNATGEDGETYDLLSGLPAFLSRLQQEHHSVT